MVKKAHPLAARIKRLMQKDAEVGKIAQATPLLIGRAMELMLDSICKQASEVVAARGGKTLTPSHIKAFIQTEPRLSFLETRLASVPNLPEGTDADAPKPKRQRVSAEGRKGKQGATTAAAAAERPTSAAAAAVTVTSPGRPGSAAGPSSKPAEDQAGPSQAAADAAAAAGSGRAAADKHGLSAHPLLGGNLNRFQKAAAAAASSRAAAAAGADTGSAQQSQGRQQAAADEADGGLPAEEQQPAPSAVGVVSKPTMPTPFTSGQAAAAAGSALSEQQQQGEVGGAAASALGAGVTLAALKSYNDDDFDDDYDS